MKKTIYLLLILNILFSYKSVIAWDNDTTHMDLSRFAADFSILRLCIYEDEVNCHYLKNIGLENGLEEYLQWGGNRKEVKEWIAKGSEYEDKPTLRSFNHFHNPLKEWGQAGLDDKLGVPLKGKSSLLWSQDGDHQQSSVGEDWSWKKTREYYYLALASQTDSERQKNFAKTFRGLGHQIHLVQDKAVPDHVRNDAHPEDSIFAVVGGNPVYGSQYFESWAKNNHVIVNEHASRAGLFNPVVSLAVSYDNLAPVTQFYDTNQYKIENSSQFFTDNQATSLTIGLAEYTNANFFSSDTVFSSERYSTDHKHYFPYPRRSSTDLEDYLSQVKPLVTQVAEDGIKDKGVYIKKERDGEVIDYFVRASRWTGKIYKLFGEGALFYKTFYRDERCHEDYVSKLVPRAVGYSAALLNYFFRGDINMVSNDSNSGFIIENNSDEDMNGTFELWYDDANRRKKAWSRELSIGKKSRSTDISFALPASDKYILVFQGKMGSENDAVAGRVIEKKQFLFMVNLGQQVLSLEIKTRNNKYELIPSSREINFITGNESSQLIVQSKPDQNEHVVMLPYSPDAYYPNITGFGIRFARYALIGTQYHYRPTSFYENSPYKLYKTAFYPLNAYSNPNLEAVGRKPFTLSDDYSRMDSFGNSVWKKILQPMTCSEYSPEGGRTCNEKIEHYMVYIDKTNKFTDGIPLGTDELYTYEHGDNDSSREIKEEMKYNFVATISDDKTIYKKNISSSEVIRTYEGYLIDEGAHCCNVGINTEKKDLSDNVSLVVGDASIVSKTGVGNFEEVATYWKYTNCQNCGYKKIIRYNVSENTQYSLDVMDYDNLYNDENIMLFYKVTEQIDSQDINETWEQSVGESKSDHKENTLKTTYHIYYKINSTTNLINLPFTETYHSEYQDGTITSTRSGERVTGVSSQINDKNIVYTYIVERWNEETEEWNFHKRIIGIINRADSRLAAGYRQEFEISESNASGFLTDMYADYDYKVMAAVGVHVN